MKKALILLICLTALSGCKNNTADASETALEQIAAVSETVSVTSIDKSFATEIEMEQTSEKAVTTSFEEAEQTAASKTISDHRITREEAKAAAFAHSELYETEIWGYETTFYYEDEIPVIEVQFDTTYNYGYMCKINATDGSVIDFLRYDYCSLEEVISPEEAEAFAFEHAGLGREDVTFIKTEREIDNVRDVYEIEFICGDTEYEYKVHSVSGDIIKCEINEQGD